MKKLKNKTLNEMIHTLGFENVTQAARAMNRERSTLYRWHANEKDRETKLIPALIKAGE